jgi:glycosyltransferase involved in cell wall biosynthesis
MSTLKIECSIVMPAYNEERSIRESIAAVLARDEVRELIVVDDASKDGTASIVEELAKNSDRLRLVRHSVNQGKGAALRTGFKSCTSDIVMIQDADLEYDPNDYSKVLGPFSHGDAAMVLGSRFAGGGAHRVLYFWHYLGNKFLTLLSNCTTNLNLTDMETGMKAFKREVLDQIVICENRFGFEPEIVAKVARLNVPVFEVPISYYGRTYAEGKKIGMKDGFRAIWCIFKYGILKA